MSIFRSKAKGVIPLAFLIIGLLVVAVGGGIIIHQKIGEKVNSWFDLTPSFSSKSQETTSKTESGSSQISSDQNQINKIIEAMKSNSKEWLIASNQTEKDKLHQANVKLAKQLETLTNSQITYNKQTGFWFKDNVPLYAISNPNAPKGALSIYSTPSGARIFVDNQYPRYYPFPRSYS